ncbi:hypothetical protein HPB49_020184 [Dermacentor silvarum]|uniref:Uncharacterized protein n=1 Tax=Dermacentor silvarum TaxID=543639 RepID=A0ACB8CM81_DERSI|nr:hypothetical protein HPB49_020184 [Dermacentor silvarum]
MAAKTKDLVAAIKDALPHITDERMLFLMQELGAKGVRCKADMEKLEAVDLVNALGTDDAKRLVAFFNTPEPIDEIMADGARSDTLKEEQAKRQQIHEATVRDVTCSASLQAGAHRATMEKLQAQQAATSREHEENLKRMREEHRLRAQKLEQEEREHLEKMERLRRQRRPAMNRLLDIVMDYTVRKVTGGLSQDWSGPANPSQDFVTAPRSAN